MALTFQTYRQIRLILFIMHKNILCDNIQGALKVSTHTLGLIPPPCFIFETCNFAYGILSLLIRGFRHQNLKVRFRGATPNQN